MPKRQPIPAPCHPSALTFYEEICSSFPVLVYFFLTVFHRDSFPLQSVNDPKDHSLGDLLGNLCSECCPKTGVGIALDQPVPIRTMCHLGHICFAEDRPPICQGADRHPPMHVAGPTIPELDVDLQEQETRGTAMSSTKESFFMSG